MKYLILNCIILLLTCLSSGAELDEGENAAFMFISSNDEFCDETPPPAPKGKKDKPQCHEEVLLSYLYSLQVINPESVIALATKNKLDKICANISKTMKEMDGYLKKCSLQPHQDVYTRLLKGVSALHKKLCTKDPYHKIFMGFKKCFTQLKSELDSCNGPADWSETADSRKVCKAYQEIADCYYIKTSVLCGNEAADAFRELVNAVIDSVITVSCANNIPGALANQTLSKTEEVKASSSTYLQPLQTVLYIALPLTIKCVLQL